MPFSSSREGQKGHERYEKHAARENGGNRRAGKQQAEQRARRPIEPRCGIHSGHYRRLTQLLPA
jgi:hypothetical protein